jgi:methyl-accepting chemotaxis protein
MQRRLAKLRQRYFVILPIVLCAISLLGTFLVSYYLFTKNLQADFHRQSSADMALFRLETQNYLTNHMNMLKMLAQTQPIRKFDYQAAKKLLADFKKTYPDIDVVLSDHKGNQVIRGDNAFLTKISSLSFYREAINGTEEVFSEYLVSQRNGQALVVLAVPVRAENGAIVGVLQGNLYLDMLRAFVTNRSEHGLTAYITDQEGKMIAHPTETVIPTRRQDLSAEPFMAKARQGESGVYESSQDGARKLINYTYEPKTHWVLCVEKTYDEYTARITELLIVYGIIFAVTIVVIVILSIFSVKPPKQAAT